MRNPAARTAGIRPATGDSRTELCGVRLWVATQGVASVRLADDRPEEERVGDRDLTRWPSRAGGLLVGLVTGLAANVSARLLLLASLQPLR